MKIKEENIGGIFKDALHDYSIKPDPKVWSNVNTQVSKKMFFKSTAFKISVAAISTVLIITAVLLLSQNNKLDNNNTQTINQTAIAETADNESIKPQNNNPISAFEPDSIPENNNIQNENIPENNTEIKQEKPQEKIIEKPKSTDAIIIQPKNISVEIDNKLIDEMEAYEKQEIKNVDSSMNDITTPDIAHESPKNEFDASKIKFYGDSIICFGEDASLKVSEGYNYYWNNGKTTNEITVSPVFDSDYSVVVSDEYGNEIEHTFKVKIDKTCASVLVPNAFSPDNDGINDKLEIYGRGITNFEIKIFNKQGQLLFISKDINDFWDGTYNGEVVNTGVYVYRIVYTDAKGNQQIKQATVSIIK